MRLKNTKISWGMLAIAAYADILIVCSPLGIMLMIGVPAIIYQGIFIARAMKRAKAKIKAMKGCTQ